MTLLRRLSLPAQLAIAVAFALFAAQAVNFALVLREASAAAVLRTVEPAAARLLLLEESADAPRPAFRRRLRERFSESDHPPLLPPGSQRIAGLETAIASRLREAGRPAEAVHVFETEQPRGGFGRGGPETEPPERMILASATFDGAKWFTTRARALPPVGSYAIRLTIQTIIIFLLTLLPVFLIARSASRSISTLQDAADRFRTSPRDAPVAPKGPRDIRDLTRAFNDMQARIAALITEKDVMLGAIGHDLRTPLAALRIRAENVDDPAERDEMIAAIEGMHGDLEDILFLARLERDMQPEPIDLRRLAEGVAQEFGSDEVAVRPGEPVHTHGYPAALRRAVRNLVENALKYGGGADIRAGFEDGHPRIAISDNGPGIPEAELETAAQPFVRLEASRNRNTGGSGLGLAIARRVAERHQGKLILENRDGGGLEAVIALPAQATR